LELKPSVMVKTSIDNRASELAMAAPPYVRLSKLFLCGLECCRSKTRHWVPKQSSKSESRNPKQTGRKQIPAPEIQTSNSNHPLLEFYVLGHFDLFRASCFEFRLLNTG
jgi:hypothetical protein